MAKTNAPKNEKKSIKELQAEHDKLESKIEQYLLVLGVDHMLVKDIIVDLKSQMCMHADDNVNDMIAELICLENEIESAKAKLPKKTEEDEINEMMEILASGK